MGKSEGQKLKLLILLRILEEKTDEKHAITVQQLISELALHEITAERKGVYACLDALCEYGVDVVTIRGKSNAYYLGERRFQLAELKLLVDSVQSAKFITTKKSSELIRKLGMLTSRHEAVLLRRQVHVQGRVKAMNESIYYNVDMIHTAIQDNRKISFRYFEWVVSAGASRLFERRWRRDGEAYEISPWSMLWDNENYYLIAYDSKAAKLKHYRVDKMASMQVLDEPRDGYSAFEVLDMGEYSKRTFGMFGGEEMDVRLRFANRLVGVAVDRFGKDIIINAAGEGHFTLTVKAQVSPQFIAWILGFGGDAQVLSPKSVVDDVLRTLREVAGLYDAVGGDDN